MKTERVRYGRICAPVQSIHGKDPTQINDSFKNPTWPLHAFVRRGLGIGTRPLQSV